MKKGGISRNILVVLVIAVVIFLYMAFLPNEEDIFFAPPINSPPIIQEIDSDFIACEGQQFSYDFEITDNDITSIELANLPTDTPFYVRKVSSNLNRTAAKIISHTLTKDDANKIYVEKIYATDGQYSDETSTKIEVIAINNPPTLRKLGVQTVELNQRAPYIYKRAIASDIEDKNEFSGRLAFNINFLEGEPIFSINSEGIMEYSPRASDAGIYEIEVCVTDSGLRVKNENINRCDSDGSPETTCEDFQLTLLDENKAPTILSFIPEKKELNPTGTEELFFNITAFDPDGTTPDTYWFIDDVVQDNTNNASNVFTHTFGCGIIGDFTIKAEITDGILNDSVSWNVIVKEVPCKEGYPSGYVNPTVKCQEEWVCPPWDLCQNLIKSYNYGIVEEKDFVRVKNECENNNWNDELCGMQIRTCIDLNKCTTINSKPFEIQACYLTVNPSCNDNLRNCHDSGCEFLVDCGGPCLACPTCSDNIQNQKEVGVDCGGICAEFCQVPKTFIEKDSTRYLFLAIILAAVVVLLLLILRIRKMKKRLSKSNDIFKVKNVPTKLPTKNE
jgi:hypothetical protein